MGAAAGSSNWAGASASEPINAERRASATEPVVADTGQGPPASRAQIARIGAASSPAAPFAGAEDAAKVGALAAGQTRDGLVAEVARAAESIDDSALVLVAVSGGPDSTAMAHLLSIARPDLRLELVHVRHGLRDDAEDAAVARAHALALEAAYHEVDVEVRVGSDGPEAAARRARWGALFDVAASNGAGWLVVGHTADDQAETVLLNLVRGAGLRGLGGIRPLRVHRDVAILRPLLRIRRADVAGFVVGEGLLSVADPTNHDPEQRRARARHDVLPTLEQLAGGPGDVVGALNRMAELARTDGDALDALAAQHTAQLTLQWGPTRALRLEPLRRLPRALSTRVLRAVAAQVGAARISAGAVDRVLGLRPGEALHLSGGAQVSCGGGWLGFAPGDLEPLHSTVLIVPGVTVLAQLGLDLHVEWPWPLAPAGDPGQLYLGPPRRPQLQEVGDAEPEMRCASPPPGAGPRARMWATFSDRITAALARGRDLVVRSRKDGDRMRCRGGMRKLQDLMVDAHVPRVCRDLMPIVVNEDDEPLWVPGVAQRAYDDAEPAGMRLWMAPTKVGR